MRAAAGTAVRSRKRAVELIVVLGLGFGSGLSACSVPLPPSSACGVAENSTLQALQAKLTVKGTLRNGRTVGPTSTGWTLVSAELHLKGDKKSVRGNILTWALPKGAPATSTAFLAVDSKARSDSTWPTAPFAVTADGVITSRGCVDEVVGTVPCGNQTGLAPAGLATHNTNCGASTS
jgi:hypothetical protein